MRINHNIAALNTHRQLNTATTNQSKSMEKLASGMRINKAGDDAAGLAISEKMRGQIRGLDQASTNAQDGISLIATAEGALNETHDILQRMRELAVQSSNDTNTDTDRKEMQKEISQLKDEINRISNDTEFNTKKLLNGSVGNTATMGANAVNIKGVQVIKSDLKADTYTVTQTAAATLGVDVKTNTTGLSAADITRATTTDISGLELGDYTLELKATGVAGEFDVTLKNSDGVSVASASSWDSSAGGPLTGTAPDGTATTFTIAINAAAQEGEMTFNLNATYGTAADFKVENSASGTEFASTTAQKITSSNLNAGGFEFKMTVNTALAAPAGTSTITTTNNALSMHIGANENQTMKVDINKIDTTSLDIKNVDVTSAATHSGIIPNT